MEHQASRLVHGPLQRGEDDPRRHARREAQGARHEGRAARRRRRAHEPLEGLGFTKEDRDINIRRIGFVCHLPLRNGVVAIASAISPYREIRDENRALIKQFVEVYVECPLEVLIERDQKGLYRRALKGEVKMVTGIDDPYEPPLAPEVPLRTESDDPRGVRGTIPQAARGAGYL